MRPHPRGAPGPHSEKQLTGWDPDGDERKWLRATLKYEKLSGLFFRRRLRRTWPKHKTFILSRTNKLANLRARVNSGIVAHQNADCDSPFSIFEPFQPGHIAYIFSLHRIIPTEVKRHDNVHSWEVVSRIS